MASVNITKVEVLGNPSIFTAGFLFEIEFECATALSSGK